MRPWVAGLGLILAIGGAGAENVPATLAGLGLLALAVLSHRETGHNSQGGNANEHHR